MPGIPQGLFHFPGIRQIIDGSLTLHHGITPAAATISIAPQAGFTALEGDLRITFGDVEIKVPDCRLNRHSFEFNSAGLVWRLAIWDKRWRWKYGTVTGNYNLRRRIYGQWDDTLDQSTRMKPRGLAAICLAAMKEPVYDLSKMPNVSYPEVHWDNDKPAQALADLAEKVGCRVILKIDGTVSIEPVGTGIELPRSPDMIQESLSIEPATIPDSIRVVGGPTRYQADFLLEPCGLDVDGQVRNIDELSYAPADGWLVNGGTSPPFYTAIADDNARALARETVCRWFRIPPAPQGLNGKALTIPGYQGDIKVREQILPIEDEQVETFVDVALAMQVQDNNVAVPVTTRMPKNKPALVWGYHPANNEGRTVLPTLENARQESIVPDSGAQGGPGGVIQSRIPGGYTIDKQFGIVKFATYQYFAVASVTAGESVPNRGLGKFFNTYLSFAVGCPSILAIRCACSIRDPAGKTPERYYREQVLNVIPKPPGRSTGPMVLKHDEIVLNLWADRSGVGNNVQNLQDNKAAGVMPGSPGVNEEMDYYVAAAMREFQSTAPYEVQYAGIKKIEPDGAIQTVTWTVSEAGAMTRATRNSEMGIVSVSYRERRFFEKIAGEELEQMRKQMKLARARGDK